MGHWTGQANRWQTNDRGHSGSGEAWSGAILLLPWGPLTQVAVVNSLLSQDAMSHGPNSKSSCPSSPPGHFPSLQRKSLLFVWQECHAPCKRNRGPQPYIRLLYYPTCIACNTTTELWFARCVESPRRTESVRRISWRMHLDDLVLWTRRLRLHGHVECSDGWLKKVWKLNPTGGRAQSLATNSPAPGPRPLTCGVSSECLGTRSYETMSRDQRGKIQMFFSSIGACTAAKFPIANHHSQIITQLYSASFIRLIWQQRHSDSEFDAL